MFALDAIKYAYREAALRPIGFTPTSQEVEEGLYRLNSFIKGIFSGELGQVVRDWNVPRSQRNANEDTNYINMGYPQNLDNFNQPYTSFSVGRDVSSFPPINSRLVVKLTSATTVFFPQFPSDGARMEYVDNNSTMALTIDANGRKIEGAETLLLMPGTSPKSWFYRADLAEWRLIEDLGELDETPLPAEYDDLFVTGLAIRLAALDEQAIQPGTVEAFQRTMKKARSRYVQANTQTFAGNNLRNSSQSYGAYSIGGDRSW